MEIRWIMPFLWGLKTSVCFDKDVRSFSIKRAFVWMETCVRFLFLGSTRARELYMEFDFDLLMLNAVICVILFDCLSDICEFIPEKVSKKFRGMLVGSAKVCTFASAFERETR